MSTAEPRVPHPRIPDEPTSYLDAATLTGASRGSARSARRALRTDQRHQRSRQRADQGRARAHHRAGEELDRRLRDPDLGHPRPDAVTARHERLSAALTADVAAGATVHRRTPRTARSLPPVIALLDGVVLFTFCAEVFNVDPTDRVSVATLAATMLALLGSGVAYVWLRLTGLRIRSYRSGLGEVAWAATGPLTRFMLAVSLVVTAALAILMYVRVSAEVADSGLSPSTAALVGAVFATLSAVANLTVVAVHALDGSDLSAELRHTGRLLHRRDRRLARRLGTTRRRAQREDRIALRGSQYRDRVTAARSATVLPLRPAGPIPEPDVPDPDAGTEAPDPQH